MPYKSVSINPQQAVADLAQARALGLQDRQREYQYNKQRADDILSGVKDFQLMQARKKFFEEQAAQQEMLGAQRPDEIISQPTVSWETASPQVQEDTVKEFPTQESAENFVAKTQGLENANPEQVEEVLVPDIIEGRAQGRDMSTSENIVKLNRANPAAAKYAINSMNNLLQSPAYQSMVARDPAAAKEFAGVLGIDASGRGKDFADKAVFTTRVRDDGSIEQGFAVYDPDSKKTTFEAIEGKGLKETAKDRREQDLEAKKELERYKTDQAFIREMNSQTRTPEGKLNLAKSRVESEQLRANKAAKTARADNAIDMLQRLEGMDLDKIYGRGESIYPELMRSQEGIDAIADRSQLISILKIMGRGELKGQGTVSDFEAKMLGDAATILGNPDISADAARREIERIKQTFTDLANGIDYENGSPVSSSKPKAQTQKNDPLGIL